MEGDEEFGWDEVVFLDLDEDWAGAGARDPGYADVQWLDEVDEVGEERLDGGRDPSVLPPLATRSRVLATLLVLALFVAGTGSAFAAAYHRHVTDLQLANLLDLRDTAAPPDIPGLAAVGFQAIWHAYLSERVVVPVQNRSPKPVVLLGAELVEQGMLQNASFAPVGAARLQPGQTGELAGVVTVDCTQVIQIFGVDLGGENHAGTLSGELPPTGMEVRARTSGGLTRTATLNPDGEGADLQERICEQEGFDAMTRAAVQATANAKTRTITLSISSTSHADVPMDFVAAAQYARDPAGESLGLALSADPTADTPIAGIVRSGGTVRAVFAIQVWSCPSGPLPSVGVVNLNIQLLFHGNPVDGVGNGVDLSSLLNEACGRT